MKKVFLLAASAAMFMASLAFAQEQNPALKPPKGAKVAIVVFEDLQCPDCRRAAPLVAQAGKTYKFPSSATITRCPCITGHSMRP